jgi:uncharacterized protein YebE (UPF0316 family)
VDLTLAVLRLLMITRGRKALAWIFSFVKSTIYLFILQLVLQSIDDPLTIFAYAAGFATGMVLGMWLEERIALGFTHLRIISPKRGAKLTELLREEGYAVTEIASLGKDGMVALLDCNVRRRKTGEVVSFISNIDPESFITSSAVQSSQRGFFRK